MPPVRGKIKEYSMIDMQQDIEAVKPGTSLAATNKNNSKYLSLFYYIK